MWVVDTSVLLDIHSADAAFSQASAECLAKYCAEGLVISPVTYVELAPAFDGGKRLSRSSSSPKWGSDGPLCGRSRTRKQRTICGLLTFERNRMAAPQNARLLTCLSRPSLSVFKG